MNLTWKLPCAVAAVPLLLVSIGAGGAGAAAADAPLTNLPYTPSLDVSSMDKTVDPCVDFYSYACGGWRKNNPIPADQASWSVYGKLADQNDHFLWGVLKEASKPAAARTVVDREIGDFFAACMDEAAVDKAGTRPIEGALDAIAKLKTLDGLPVLLADEHQSTAARGLLFGFGSDQDFDDSEQVLAAAAAGGLGLPDRDYYSKSDAKSVEVRQRYVAHIAEMLGLIGESPTQASAHAAQIMAIETKLAAASLTRVQKRDPHNLNHKMSPEQLQALTPAFNWGRYLAAMGLPSVAALNVTEPAFFTALQSALTTVDVATWKEYLRWHLVSAAAPVLSSKLAEASFDFYSKYLHGIAAQKPRWKRCVQWTNHALGEALGQAFVKKVFSADLKARTLAMTVGIEKAMEREINALPWMGAETKRHALEKLHTIANKVGYPDRWRDYSSIEIKRDDFAGDMQRATRFESKRQLAKIGRPLDRGEWDMTPPTVNAYYNPQMNDINFPAGVLQPPLYDAKLDDAPNFGNTGATIGHELTHGFDDEGRQFDARGNLKDWWTQDDAKQFEKRAQCVVDQYAGYTIVDDIKINSKLTLGEDVADLGGTLLAYIAWKAATAGQKLPSVEGFSPDQRFFVGMAQWACENQRPENLRVNAVTNAHSPGKYRINGVVANLPEFAAAFQCRAKQPMVRDPVCRIW
jgi:putative endopeptidase